MTKNAPTLRSAPLSTLGLLSLLGLCLAVAGCQYDPAGRDVARGPGPGGTPGTGVTPSTPESAAGGEDNTFDHPDALNPMGAVDSHEVLSRMAEEGPPGYRARLHGCRKIRYQTVGRVLGSYGLNADNSEAYRLWQSSDTALGAPNYGARIPELDSLSTSNASRLFDIFAAAAPEVIAAFENPDADLSQCEVSGGRAQLFDETGTRCMPDGLSCILGTPATEAHVALCEDTIANATTPERGRSIAIAAMLAAANTCE